MVATLLLTQEEIQRGVRVLAKQIAQEFPEGPIPIVCVDTAACCFSGDLLSLLESEYGRHCSITHINPKAKEPFPGKLLDGFNLVVDTLFDTGRTFKLLEAIPGLRVTLCIKDEIDRHYWRFPDWWAYLVPNVYIHGYGLDDSDGLSRDLEDILTNEPLAAGSRALSRLEAKVPI
ncbi:MAG: hypothetical protein CL897_05880 [Dehalococcoidia bacterium]|mgnify:CR=1 FL=1|nr:hypothetical protein [Dehalococcoidia bacterium]